MKSVQFSFLFRSPFFACGLAGDSPVDRSEPLKPVSDDFELADGPSWSGWALTVPDPKSQVAKRFVPKQKKWQAVAKEKRFSASFFNHGKTYFADNGTGAIRCLDQKNQWTLLHQEDLSKDRRRKPNDLVVDRSGGVYFTLTGPGKSFMFPRKAKLKPSLRTCRPPMG